MSAIAEAAVPVCVAVVLVTFLVCVAVDKHLARQAAITAAAVSCCECAP